MTKGRHYDSRVGDYVIVHLGLNASSSDHNCRRVIDGGNYGSNLSIIIIVFWLIIPMLYCANVTQMCRKQYKKWGKKSDFLYCE